MGEDFCNRGMTSDQMSYFYNAIQSVEATDIDNQTMAFGRVMADKESSRGINKAVDQKRHAAVKALLQRK